MAIAEAVWRELGNRVRRPPAVIQNICSELSKGRQTRDVAAERAGFGSHMTLKRAKRVHLRAKWFAGGGP